MVQHSGSQFRLHSERIPGLYFSNHLIQNVTGEGITFTWIAGIHHCRVSADDRLLDVPETILAGIFARLDEPLPGTSGSSEF